MGYRSKRKKKMETERFLKRFFFFVFTPLAIFFLAIILIFNANFLKLKNIEYVDARHVDIESVKAIVEKELSGRYFGIFDKDNIIFYPENEIKNEIFKSEKRILSLEIKYFGFFSGIKIEVYEKTPEFLYCILDSEKCFYMEKSGAIFTSFKGGEGEKKKKDFLIFWDLSREKEFLKAKDFQDLLFLVNGFDRTGLSVESVAKDIDGDFVFNLSGEQKVFFRSYQDREKLLETIGKMSVANDLEIDFEKKRFKKNISYVNMAFNDTIFYCMKGEKCEINYQY